MTNFDSSSDKYLRLTIVFSSYLAITSIRFLDLLSGKTKNVFSMDGLSGLTDTLGLVRVTQMSRLMEFPWSSQAYTNFPHGEFVWNLTSLTQSISLGFLWACSKVMSPFQAANLWIIVGFAVTAFAVYFLARSFGISRAMSYLAGFFSSFLPSMIVAAATVPSLAYSGFPLLIAALLIRWKHTKNNRYFYIASSLLAFSLLLDGYVYYFGFTLFWIFFLFNLKGFASLHVYSPWASKVFTFWSLAIPFLAFFLHRYSVDRSPSVRPLLPPTISMMNSSPFEILNFANALGAIIFVLACASVFLIKLDQKLIPLIVSATVLLLISSRGYLVTEFIDIPNPSIVILGFFPGAVYLDRAVFVAEKLLVVLAFASLSILFRKLKLSQFVKFSIVIVVFVVAIGQAIGNTKFNVLDESSSYKGLRAALNGEPTLFLPHTYFGRSWIQQVFLDVPMVNSLHDVSRAYWLGESLRAISSTDDLCDLRRQGVHKIVMEESFARDFFPVSNISGPNLLTMAGQGVVPAYERGETRLLVFTFRTDC